MIAYTQNEKVGITELSKSLSEYIQKVSSNSIQKLAVVRHNKPEVVIIGIEEYEKMKQIQDYLEDLEIAQIIKDRTLEKEKMLSQKDMFEYLKQKGLDV